MAELTPDQEAQKRYMYEKMSPRRRKFVDRLGYENWDPFQMPKDPIDIREDKTKLTAQKLVALFLNSRPEQEQSKEYVDGVSEAAMGLVNQSERFQGIYEFCLWRCELLKQQEQDNG